MISLAEFQSMTLDQRWERIKSASVVRPSDMNIKSCKPDYIGPLYTNTPFPHFPKKGQTTSITLSDGNIYDGTVIYESSGLSVNVTWKGYSTQLYDGTLKLCPVNESSTIEGVWNNVNFKFKGTTFEYGVWPGFIELYK